MRHGPASLLALLLACLAAHAQDALDRRAHEASGILSAQPNWPEGMFDPAFSRQVSDDQLRGIGRDFFSKAGAVKTVLGTSRTNAHSGSFDLVMEKGVVVPMQLTISDKPPHQVVGLFFGKPVPLMKDMPAVAKALRKLGGRISFGVWKLGDGEPQPLATLDPDTPLAIGSAFKLYVLGTLMEQLKAGRSPAHTVPLTDACRSLPSGQMQEWPANAPVTLSTAANLMIAQSDNTATDLLIRNLGRENIEAMLPVMGMKDPARNRPFLTTVELFRLKLMQDESLADEYLKLDEAGRRRFLQEKVASGPLDLAKMDVGGLATPNRIDQLEWFASASDLCRALDWIRVAGEGPAGSPARTLRDALAINRGLDISEDRFPWVGFKGGSEPGVICLAYLLQDRAGTWHALAVAWNETEEGVQESELAALVQRAIFVLGDPQPAAPVPASAVP